MKKLCFILILSAIFLAKAARAGFLAPSGQEVRFSFEAKFVTKYSGERSTDLIEQHYQHLFGYSFSPTVLRQFGLHPNKVGGIGAPKLPLKTSVISDRWTSEGRVIQYRAQGTMLLETHVAKKLLKEGSWDIYLPYQLDDYYDENCTDPDYDAFDDFWYFYDPYAKGCSALLKSPMAESVTFRFSELKGPSPVVSPRLDLLRGNNSNGDLFQITTLNGFDESSTSNRDLGRRGYEEINKWLRQQGFEESIESHYRNRPVHVFEKDLESASGRRVHVRITRLLAEISIDERTVTFANYFKQAIEEADVLIYAGHSGLGGNLDIPSLEEKVGRIRFNDKKRQIFFFDGCSTYSHYLQSFEEQKTRSKLDVMVNGLSSLYDHEKAQTSRFLEILLDLDREPTWMELLTELEGSLKGGTYLLGVGSL